MKLTHLALVVALSAVTAFAVGKYAAPSTQQMQTKETAFERVLRTNTLRCGYVTHAPLIIKDPQTGEMSGLIADMMDYFTRKTGVKVEWSEEVTFGNWVMAIQSGRIDGVCTTIWPDVSFARVAKFTKPFFFLDMLPVVRADETRFGIDANEFNKETVSIGVLEGDSLEALSRVAFPKAQIVALPPNSDASILLQSLVDKKVDMVPWDRNSVYQFDKGNPGKVKLLHTKEPIRLIPSEFVVGANETALADMLDELIDDMLNNGEMERILTKWEPTPGIFLRVGKPYVPVDTQ